MIIHADFRELLQLFENHNVDYMIVGGYAVAFHGYPRFTKDLDIFYRISNDNIARLSAALVEFGFTPQDIESAKLSEPGDLVAFGFPPARVDLLNQIDGVTFNDAESSVVMTEIDGLKVRFIGRDHLLQNKMSTSHLQDKLDVEKLQ